MAAEVPLNVPPELAAALKAEAGRFAAEEAAREAKEPGAVPPGAAPGAGPAFDAALTASVIVTLVDLAIATFISQKLKLADSELAAITAKTEPVVRMYLPPELFLGPVGALAATAGAIYTAKLIAPDPATPPGAQTVDGTATPTPPAQAETPAGAPGIPS